jgi:hypothetical protein
MDRVGEHKMSKMRSLLVKHWFRLSLVCVLIIAVLLGTTGVQLVNRSVEQPDVYGIGLPGDKVLTLGSTVEAAGLVDYTFTGVNDNAQFTLAINALPNAGAAVGGRLVVVSATQINFAALTSVTRVINNVTIEGSGAGTYFVGDGVTSPFTAGGNNWVLNHIRVNVTTATLLAAMGATTGWSWEDVTTTDNHWTYRTPNIIQAGTIIDSGLTANRITYAGAGGQLSDTANLTLPGTSATKDVTTLDKLGDLSSSAWVLGSNSTPEVIAYATTLQAAGYPIWVADGTDDEVQIQAAYDSLTAGRTVIEEIELMGSFSIAADITIGSYVKFNGPAKITSVGTAKITNAGHANITDIGFENLTFIGDANLGGAIYFNIGPDPGPVYYHQINVRVLNCNFTNFERGVYGILDQSKVDNCNFYNCMQGIYLDAGVGTSLTNNYFKMDIAAGADYWRGMKLVDISNCTISDNTFDGATSDYSRKILGIELVTSYRLVFSNNTYISLGLTGIAIDSIVNRPINSGNIIISNEQFKTVGSYPWAGDNRGYGAVWVGGVSQSVSNVLMIGCELMYTPRFMTVGKFGLVIANSKIDILSNTASGDPNGTIGWGFYGTTYSGLNVKDNIIHNPSAAIPPAMEGTGQSGCRNTGYIFSGETRSVSGTLTKTGSLLTTVTGTFTETGSQLIPGVQTLHCTVSGTATITVPVGSNGVAASVGGGATVTSGGALVAGTNTVAVTAGGTNEFTVTLNNIGFAWHNPELQDILISKAVVYTTTVGGTATSVLDVGIADDALATNRGVEFFADIDLNASAIVDSTVVAGGGTQTVWVLCQDSASVTDGWIVGSELVEKANNLVGSYYIEYVGK